MKEKQKEIKCKTVGKTLVVVIDKKSYPYQGEATNKKLIRDEIERYNKINTESRLAKIKKLLTPAAEKAKTALVVQKKKIKHEQKELQREISETKQDDRPLNEALEQVKKLSETNAKNEQRIAELEELVKKSQAVPEKRAETGQRRGGEY